MAITIKDVARHCGMSISTVSKVFNQYPDISRETRSQVLKAARQLGYQPNALARALKTNRSYNLGVLLADDNVNGLTHPFFASVLNAFKAEAEARRYDITFINHNIGASEMTYLEHCRYRNVDGVCLVCVDFASPEVEELVSSDIPCVAVDHLYSGRPCVLSDNLAGIRALVDHVVSQGHRHIAYIHGQQGTAVTQKRVAGFLRAMEAHGLPVGEGCLVEGRYNDIARTKRQTAALLARPDAPTCILLPDDISCLGALEAAREAGMIAPEDISLAGFDGLWLTQSLHPRLTTVCQDVETMGREAAAKLIACVERSDAAHGEPLLIPTRLEPGETVGPPAKR